MTTNKNISRKIVLASGSPRRKEILENLGLTFEIATSDYEEDMTLDMTPDKLVKFLALGKAKSLVKKYNDHLLISADTIMCFDNKVIGKPANEKEARKMLTKISGNKVTIFSGISLIDTKTKKEITEFSKSRVFFKKMTKKNIEDYVKTGEPMDKAGSFSVQGLSSIFIERIDGDYFSIVGLSASVLSDMLNKFGVKII